MMNADQDEHIRRWAKFNWFDKLIPKYSKYKKS